VKASSFSCCENILMKNLYFLVLLIPIIGLSQDQRDNSWQMEDYKMVFDSTGLKIYPRWSDIREIQKCVASINDVNGNLLAYTNGCQVANSKHQLMTNGDSLNYNESFYRDFRNDCSGGYPNRQDILMLPDPGNEQGFYILHMQDDVVTDLVAGTIDFLYNRMNYSYIDMNLEDGLGGVVNKNESFFEGEMKSSPRSYQSQKW